MLGRILRLDKLIHFVQCQIDISLITINPVVIIFNKVNDIYDILSGAIF